MKDKLLKEKIDEILFRSHQVINSSTGLDISKSKRDEARRESRKILKELKDLDITIYNIVKEEFNG
jgi:hypothetical protein|tara:strand:+ start:736 stop:933 length:198 start_codon:yes stop_codon:yes gene_type:complete